MKDLENRVAGETKRDIKTKTNLRKERRKNECEKFFFSNIGLKGK